MRKILALAAVLVAMFATSAFANSYGSNSFALFSSASASIKTSSAIALRGFKTKSVMVEGATLTSNAGAVAFKNMSGTVIIQCSQDNTTWETCIANDYAQTAVSRTTNGIFTWSDAFAYVRLKWTSGTIGGKLKAWLTWQE